MLRTSETGRVPTGRANDRKARSAQPVVVSESRSMLSRPLMLLQVRTPSCSGGYIGEMIARFGVDGDYLSGMRFATDGPLKEAKTRAIVAGFLMPNGQAVRRNA